MDSCSEAGMVGRDVDLPGPVPSLVRAQRHTVKRLILLSNSVGPMPQSVRLNVVGQGLNGAVQALGPQTHFQAVG